jgi:hypothetical protein
MFVYYVYYDITAGGGAAYGGGMHGKGIPIGMSWWWRILYINLYI